jgi:ligand-binding SRPBCC domain-containing protein
MWVRRSPWPLTFTITDVDPGRLFTDETRLPGVRLGHEHAIEHDGATTTIRHRLYFDGPAEKIYALLMGRQMRAAVRQFGERERDLAERG